MSVPSLIELAESGAHYGHHRSLTYPKSKTFVYAVKNNISLINLEETQKCIEEARAILNEYRHEGRPVLFVGTKRSLRAIVKDVAESAALPYIVERWYGGFLTNFTNFLDQLRKMKELEAFLVGPKAEKLEKKERMRHQERFNRYHRFLGGATKLNQMPELLIVASATEDRIAINEARKSGVKVIAITDTDVNPSDVDYPIPANDDAPRAVELILRALVAAPAQNSETSSQKETTESVADEVPQEPVAVKKPKKAVAKAEKKPAKKAATKSKK